MINISYDMEVNNDNKSDIAYDKKQAKDTKKYDPNKHAESYIAHIWWAYWIGYSVCISILISFIIYCISKNQISLILALGTKIFLYFAIYTSLPLVLFSLIGISNKLVSDIFIKTKN